MEYKYRKNQIFGKRLKVPKHILTFIYNNMISLEDFVKYDLYDKIPTSCITPLDRQIIEKFGYEKVRDLDWQMFNVNLFYNNISVREILMGIDSNVTDLNLALYEKLKDIIRPSDYSPRMKELYSERLINTEGLDSEREYLARMFNNGRLYFDDIIRNWDLFKDKDLSYCLSNDVTNIYHITNIDIIIFMERYKGLLNLIKQYANIQDFMNDIKQLGDEDKIFEYVKSFTDKILKRTFKTSSNPYPTLELSDEEYREIFKYSSLEDFLRDISSSGADKLIPQLEGQPSDYLFNLPIPFHLFRNSNVLWFVGEYGLQNVLDFDDECGHFFTKDDCKMLKIMYGMYLHYAGGIHDSRWTFYTKQYYDEDGNFVEKPYTKDDFYEAMRRMIVYGPTDGNYINQAPDYRSITGEFQNRNPQLFLKEDAPEELQKMFYTKSVTPHLLREHPEYIDYLEGKDFYAFFYNRELTIHGSKDENGLENIYQFILNKTNYDHAYAMKIITEYADIFDILFDKNIASTYRIYSNISMDDNIEVFLDKINNVIRNILLENNVKFPKVIPKEFRNKYPSLLLDTDAPQELQDTYYSRNITEEFILAHPNYVPYLKKLDLEFIYKYIRVDYRDDDGLLKINNIVSIIKDKFGSDEAFDIMLLYNKYLQIIKKNGYLGRLNIKSNCSKEELLDEIDNCIYNSIVENGIKYDDNISNHFKNKYPTLFLNEDVPLDIRDKFYNKKLMLSDFNNSGFIDLFGDTNIAGGFPENLSWVIPLFENESNGKKANYNRLKVISAYLKIKDLSLRDIFKKHILENIDTMNLENIDSVNKVLLDLNLSNSSEVFTFRNELARQILKSSNPVDSLNKVQEVFIKNNIPIVGKIFNCFEILHPNFEGFDFSNDKVSPVLKKASNMSRKIIVFSDLIKAALGSNNRSIINYLKNIEVGYDIYLNIKNGNVQFDSISTEERLELVDFSKHLMTLYNNTMDAKEYNKFFNSSGDVIRDISSLEMLLSPNGSLDYNLADRVIKMFCGFAGIKSLEDAKNYAEQKVNEANERNKRCALSDFSLKKGDFVKGIGGITFLRNILQNGSLSKEYLGSSAASDATPLDTDVSMIIENGSDIKETIENTAATSYGPIWFVLKNDDRFIISRDNEKETDAKRDLSKLEVFYTGALGSGHYGIRTGFASSDINYILVREYDSKVGLEIAMNGFYIPVVDFSGKIVFSPKDYDMIRSKMNGLKYFNNDDYNISNNLFNDEIEEIAMQIDQSNEEVRFKRSRINAVLEKSLNELGLHLKTVMDGDLTPGYVELIDTGSTGRGTNKPGDGDFDFMMRLDKNILADASKLNELKSVLLRNLGKNGSSEVTGNGDFRLKNVEIDSDLFVDIDITFTEKTDKVMYSTDMALQDRLATIKKNHPDKYNYVVANILLAKKVLKECEAYKPNRGEIPQGGLGGVGIENWILQNGGSFYDAARDFVSVAEGKSFEEFKKTYEIWDFGDNHLAERNGRYPHDNFVSNNMSEEGYKKMVNGLKTYLQLSDEIELDSSNIKR